MPWSELKVSANMNVDTDGYAKPVKVVSNNNQL